MGCRRLTYYQNLTELNTVSSKKELTLKNTVQTSRSNNLYRYNGKEKDEHTGLYEYGQRYYAPWLCRFVSVDPIAEDYPQLSSYNYAGNKPITSPDIEGLQGTQDNRVVKDGAGRSTIVDSGAQFVEGDTAIISQDGDKYVNINGVGLVKDTYLSENIGIENTFDSTSPSNTSVKNLMTELTPRVVESTGSAIEDYSIKRAKAKVDEGYLVGSNDKVYKSSRKTKTGTWAHKGNQYFSTKSIDPLKHPKLLGWRNVIGKGVKSLGSMAGMSMGFASMTTDDRMDPFSLIPISFLTDSQLEEYDKIDQENLDMSISQGYDSVKSLIAGQKGNSNNLAMKDLVLEDIQADVLWQLLEGAYPSYESILEAKYSSAEERSYGVLIKFTDNETGYAVLGIFNKPKK